MVVMGGLSDTLRLLWLDYDADNHDLGSQTG